MPYGKSPKSPGLSRELDAYRSAFELSLVGAAFMNLEGRLLWVNSAFSALLGYPPEEFTGLYPKDFVHPDDAEGHLKRWAELVSGSAKATNADRRWRHKDGRYVWINITSSPVFDNRDELTHVLIIGQDASARKRGEQELREGKDRISAILEAIQDVVWSRHPKQGKLLYINSATQAIYGRSPREFYENPNLWLEAVHPEDRAAAATVRERLAKGPTEDVYRIVRPDGEIRWVHSRAWPTFGPDGQPARIEGVLRDVTETRGAERALRESEARLQLVMAAGKVGVWEVEAATGEAVWTSVMREICGFPPDTPARRETFERLIHPEDRESAVREFEEVAAGRRQAISPFRIIRADGTQRWLQGFATLLRVDDQATRVQGALMDITESRESERTIEAQRVKMAAASKMSALGEMAGGLAHEINNPVAIIHGHAALLRQLTVTGAVSSETLRRSAETIEQTAERISKIVKSLRMFARDAEQDPFKRVAVRQIVEETAEFCRTRLQHHGIAFHIDPIPAELHIECRSVQISQVLLNLLNNAHDAVETLPERWVRISVEDDGARVRIAVTDSGQGIPAAIRGKLFQPFFTTKEVGRGTGLGLSVSSGIIASHSGTLSIDEACPNTRFVISLPKRR